MKVCIYIDPKTQKVVEKSGVGRAVYHQMRALELAGAQLVDKPEDADVVHINNVFLDSFLAAKRVRKQGIPLVYHGHSTKEDFRNSYIGANLAAGLFKQWIKTCYSLGDAIITPTEYSKRLLTGYGIKKPIFAVSNGIDLNDYQRSEEAGREFRKKYGYSESDKVIMSAGLLMMRKGVPDFVELARRCPEYKFIWFGTANMKFAGSKIRKAVSGKPDNMIFAGYVDKPQLQAALSGSDLFLFPSHEETEGIVVLEALAMHTPALLRDIPVYGGWLEDGAAFAKDIDGFEVQLKKILTDDGLKNSLAERGYEAACRKSIDRIGEQLLAVYNEAIKRCKSAG